MSKKRKKSIALALPLAAALIFAACSGAPAPAASLPDETEAASEYAAQRAASLALPGGEYSPSAENDYISVDASTASEGYFAVDCSRVGSRKLKLGVKKGGLVYFYDLFEAAEPVYFPLQMGGGEYAITVYEHIEGERYSEGLALSADANLKNEFAPFLLPSQIVDYDRDSRAVLVGLELAYGCEGDVEAVSRIFEYLTASIEYDNSKAQSVENGELVGYLPDVDETLATKKGICYDYASLFAAMLRANGIPAKLVKGYVLPEDLYHAWNLIYTTDAGWIAKEIRFEGGAWELADATFACGEGGKNSYEPVYEY